MRVKAPYCRRYWLDRWWQPTEGVDCGTRLISPRACPRGDIISAAKLQYRMGIGEFVHNMSEPHSCIY